MSRKTARNQTNPERGNSRLPPTPATTRGPRWGLMIGAVATVLLVVLAGRLLFTSKATQPSPSAATANAAVLASEHSPTLGDASAVVHIVEFLDPACAACATMHTEVKRLLALYPDKVRLTARHVAFHDGSDYAIKVLEAAKKQGKYWQTLEALYAAQSSWVVDNVVQPAALWRAVEHLGLNAEQLKSDFYDPEVAEQFDQDIRDARLLRVAETPKFFVNARPVPRIGSASLQMSVRDSIREEY